MTDAVIGLQRFLDDISLPRDEHDAMAAAAEEIEHLREALYEIIRTDHHNHYDGPPSRYVQIARLALSEKQS